MSKTKPKDFKICVVDDHVQTCISLATVLLDYGFKSIQAYNGKNAIELCKKEKPDLMLVDIKMPEMNGYEVAEKLPNQKIILMTAFGNDEISDTNPNNVSSVLEKPVGVDVLLNAVCNELKIPVPKI